MAHDTDMPGVMRMFVRSITPRSPTKATLVHRTLVLLLTFLAYTCYHMTRKSLSVVKTVLTQNCTGRPDPPVNTTDPYWCDWAPFGGPESDALLSSLDSAFLFAYAIAMFGSGFVAERVNLRYFLSLGMIFSGVFGSLLGVAKIADIHSLTYFIAIQIFFGIAQTTGWPSVIVVVDHWFGKGRRGLIFGVWNSHTSVGNILGSLIAGYFVERNWAYSFIAPGAIMVIVGVLIFCFLIVFPEDVGCQATLENTPQGINVAGYVAIPESDGGADSDDSMNRGHVTHPAYNSTFSRYQGQSNSTNVSESSPILSVDENQAIGFMGALKIPGVIEFSLSLFFAKLVSYTFLFWLPRYIVDSTESTAEDSANLSTFFDIGGIVGAIVAGVVSDSTHMPATTCVTMLISSIPSLILYQFYGAVNYALSVTLLLIAGAFVNGPYSLITTAVSAELGTHESLQGNAKALATVTAIIDGTGSIGAAVGPLLAGLVSPTGWDNVFYLLIASAVLSLVLLARLTYWEVNNWRGRHHRSL